MINSRLKSKLPKIICVVGPTAAGKTKLGVNLAGIFNGEIISADSRQVYKHLDISTGKDKGDYIYNKKKISYHLIDILEPSQGFSAADFQKKAFEAIDSILKRKKLPIVVGGSPFYVYSISEGWDFPRIKRNQKLRDQLNKIGLEELQSRLKKLDPEAYKKIDINNFRRLIRAIEIVTLTGKSFEQFKPKSKPKYQPLFLGIKFPLSELKERIKKRLEDRLKEGIVEEAQKVIEEGKANWEDLDKMGLEPRYISYFLQGKINKEEMKELLIRAIYQFARRQMNWFGKDERIRWVREYKKAEKIASEFLFS